MFGDTLGRSTTLGSAPMVGGFSLSTQTSVDPYYTLYPSPQVRGAVRTPTTADLYVDGRLVSSVRLPPGQFTLSDLPLETGLGNARVILRDAFGREQTINLGFYLSTQLLKRGEQDYSYSAGWERTVSGTTVEYGRPLGTAFHAVGVADWLTLGFQAEGAKDLAMGGAAFNMRLWRLGTFGLEGLASQVPPRNAATPRPASTSFFRIWSAAISAPPGSARDFATSFSSLRISEQVTADGSVSTSLGWLGSLTVGATLGGPDAFSARTTQATPDYLGSVAMPAPTALQTTVSSQHDRLLRLSYTANLTSRAQLSLNATRTDKRPAPTTWEGFASLTFALGWRTVASALTSVDPEGQALTTVNLQRSLPLGPGFGFRIDADTQEPYRTQGIFEVQSRRAVIGVRADAAKDNQTIGTISLAGSIVGIGGQVLLSRPVDDGFALVRVPETKGVRVLANNQEQGRTGRNGSLFVPDLQSYLSSPISIVQDDVPVDVKLGEVSTEHRGAVSRRRGRDVRGEADSGGDRPPRGRRHAAVLRHAVDRRRRTTVFVAAERRRRVLFRGSAARRSRGGRHVGGSIVPRHGAHAEGRRADDRHRRGPVRGGGEMTLARSALIAGLGLALLFGAGGAAGTAGQLRPLFPLFGRRGCQVGTRPLSFGNYDPIAGSVGGRAGAGHLHLREGRDRRQRLLRDIRIDISRGTVELIRSLDDIGPGDNA